jgi:hypothetical protein
MRNPSIVSFDTFRNEDMCSFIIPESKDFGRIFHSVLINFSKQSEESNPVSSLFLI